MGVDDSVQIDTTICGEQVTSIKNMVILYFVFMFVVSDIFINSILSKFSGAVEERDPTTMGIFLQGLFIILFYILALYLAKNDIL